MPTAASHRRWAPRSTGLPANGATRAPRAHAVYNPSLFFDDSDHVHVLVVVTNCGTPGACITSITSASVVVLRALNRALTSWSAPTTIRGTFGAGGALWPTILSPKRSPFGKWTLWYNDWCTNLTYATSNSMTSGFVQRRFGNWMGNPGGAWQTPFALPLSDGSWWLYPQAGPFQVSVSRDNWDTWSDPVITTGISGIATFGLLDRVFPTNTIPPGRPADTPTPVR